VTRKIFDFSQSCEKALVLILKMALQDGGTGLILYWAHFS